MLKQNKLEKMNEEVLNTLLSSEPASYESKKSLMKEAELFNNEENQLEALSIFGKKFGVEDLAKEIENLNTLLSTIYEKQLQLASKSVNTKELVLVSLLYKSRKSLKNIISHLSFLEEKMTEVVIDNNNINEEKLVIEKELIDKEEEIKSIKNNLISIKDEIEEKERIISEFAIKLEEANERNDKVSKLEKELELKEKTISDLDKRYRADYEGKISYLEKEIRGRERIINDLKDSKIIESPSEIQHRKPEPTYTTNHVGASELQHELLQKEIKELQQAIAKKDLELMEARIKEYNKELFEKINKPKENDSSFKEYTNELKSELEKRYEELAKEKINGLEKQMESSLKERQKEWEDNRSKLNEQHKTELLILEDRYQKQLQSFKTKIQELEKELGVVGNAKNTILNLFNKNKNENTP